MQAEILECLHKFLGAPPANAALLFYKLKWYNWQ